MPSKTTRAEAKSTSSRSTRPKIVIVHDWLTNMGGAEPLVLEIQKIFPNAPIFTSVYDKAKMAAFNGLDVKTTYLQQLIPKPLRYKHILWPTFRASAFRKLNLSDYDIIISSSSAEAKAVKKTRPGQKHIAYIHTPPRYYWSHYEEFKKEFKFGVFTPFIRPVIPYFVKKMRALDLASTKDIDIFIANSTVTKDRIKKYYNKPSTVIYPPVEVNKFAPKPGGKNNDRSGYVIWGRHVPYKRFDIAIQAANKLGAKLTIAGSGPDTKRLKALAGPTVKFVGRISDQALIKLAHSSKAFLFPNEEDFGIAAAEALAAGTPLIAYKKGGSLDIVEDGVTGLFFSEQSVNSLVSAMQKFEEITNKDPNAFLPATLHRKAKRFDKSLFATKMKNIVTSVIE